MLTKKTKFHRYNLYSTENNESQILLETGALIDEIPETERVSPIDDSNKQETIELTRSESEVIAQNYLQSLEESLWYAKTSTRKGKKETEKLTFALTSTQWLERKAKKEEVKKKKNLEKEERN